MDSQKLTLISTQLCAKRLPRILTLIAILLIVLGSLGQFARFVLGHDHLLGFVPLFNLNGEHNIPSFFSALLLILASALLALIYSLAGKQRHYWLTLAMGFGVMALDESVSLHERLVQPMRELLGHDQNFGAFYFAWVVPALLLVLILGLYFLRFLWRLDSATRLAFVLSGIVYLSGALGMEMLGGWYDEKYGPETMGYAICFTVEETLEMVGVIYFIRALLNYLAAEVKVVSLSF